MPGKHKAVVLQLMKRDKSFCSCSLPKSTSTRLTEWRGAGTSTSHASSSLTGCQVMQGLVSFCPCFLECKPQITASGCKVGTTMTCSKHVYTVPAYWRVSVHSGCSKHIAARLCTVPETLTICNVQGNASAAVSRLTKVLDAAKEFDCFCGPSCM